MDTKANDILNDINLNISKLNEAPIFKTISNINSVLTLLNRITDAAEAAASAVASVFEAASSIDVSLNNDLEIMQEALGNLGVVAYEKFQNPMRSAVQDVTEYVNILTNSITDGALSESFDKIADGMSSIADVVVSITAGDALPAAINFTAVIIDNWKTLSSIAVGLTAGLALYATVAASASIMSLSLGEAIILLAAKIDIAIMSINPFALALAAATAGIVSIAAALKIAAEDMDIAAHGDAFVEKTREETKALKEQRQTLEDLKKSQNEKTEADLTSAKNVKKLWEELQTYVDETSGNVNDVNKRASGIIELLNENYNMNIEYIDGQIKGYNELADSMDNYVEKMRLESQIRSGQDAYDYAVANYDDFKEKQEELLKQKEFLEGLVGEYHDQQLYETEGIIAEQLNAIKLELEEVDGLVSDCESEMAEYEGLFSKKVEFEAPQIQTDNIEEAAEDISDALDFDLDFSLDDYASGNNIFGYDLIAAEDTVEDVKQTMQNMWDSISKQERLGLISSEKAYEEQLKLIQEYCPEYADEWYSYYQEITEYQRNALKDQVQDVKDGLSDIVSRYQTEFGKIENSMNGYKNKLLSVGSVFSIDTKTDDEGNVTQTTYSVENLTEQMNKMQKYHDLIKNLKERGLSNEVLGELTNLEMDDGMTFAENLAGSSDAELKRISKLYAAKEKLADDLASELYAPEMDKLNSELIADITDQFGTLPAEIREIGGQSLSAFIEGILGDKENLTEAAQEFMDSFFTACDEGISSGAIGMANVGDSIAAALGEQDTYAIGYEKGGDLIEGLKDGIGGINDMVSEHIGMLMSVQAGTSAELAAGQMNIAHGSYEPTSWSGSSVSRKSEKIILENHEDIRLVVDGDVLARTVREANRKFERGTGT